MGVARACLVAACGIAVASGGAPCPVADLRVAQLDKAEKGWLPITTSCEMDAAVMDTETCTAQIDAGVCDASTCEDGTWNLQDITCAPDHWFYSVRVSYLGSFDEATAAGMRDEMLTYLRDLFGFSMDVQDQVQVLGEGAGYKAEAFYHYTKKTEHQVNKAIQDAIDTARADAGSDWNMKFQITSTVPEYVVIEAESQDLPQPTAAPQPEEVPKDDDDGFDFVPILLIILGCLLIIGAWLAYRVWNKKRVERANKEMVARELQAPIVSSGDGSSSPPAAPVDGEAPPADEPVGLPPIKEFKTIDQPPLATVHYRPDYPQDISQYACGVGRGRIVDQGKI